jgi:hypothetical protein
MLALRVFFPAIVVHCLRPPLSTKAFES